MREHSLYARLRRFILCSFFALCLTGPALIVFPQNAEAGCGCTGCPPGDCNAAAAVISTKHGTGRGDVNRHTSAGFTAYRNWISDTLFPQHIYPALQRMTAQMSAVAMQQVLAIGMFLDADQQLETQRLFQELQAQAHKDYQPSEDFCWFGTNVRSLAGSEQKARHNALALNERQMKRHLSNRGLSGAESIDYDKLTRWRQFAEYYCDVHDNNWQTGVANSGLNLACTNAAAAGGPPKDKRRLNIDIDYTRLLEEPRTLDVDFTNDTDATDDEQDVLAMGNNLYGHNTLLRSINKDYLGFRQYQHLYLALRSVAAKRSVAENSYASIVGLKSSGTSEDGGGGDSPRTREFLAAVLVELGVPAAEAFNMLGENPSYYAQLEILAKKIYQSPDFYANLYDKPANVERKSVALKAIELMLDRAIYESQIRQEMTMSVLLSSRLRNTFRDINQELPSTAGGG